MRYQIRPVLAAALILTLGSSLWACNLRSQLSAPAHGLVEEAAFLPGPLFAGSQTVSLDLRLGNNRLRTAQAYTAGIGEVSRQFAYRDAQGHSRYLIEIKLLKGLKPGTYSMPLTLTDQRGRRSSLHPQLTIVRRPAKLAPVITAAAGLKAFAAVLPQSLESGNRLTMLPDGPAAFDTWIKTIAGARQQINIQTYFLEGDGLSSIIIDLLKRKAESGVEVNLLMCRYSQLGKAPIIPLALKGNGINVIMAGDIGFPHDGPSLFWIRKMHDDYRIFKELPKEAPLLDPAADADGVMIDFALHEKMLVVDGRTAIVGGRNISDSYFWWWRDLDLLIEGPLVRDVQTNFKKNWYEFKGRPIRSPEIEQDYQPLKNGLTARLVCSSPWKDEYYNLEMLLTAIELSRDHVYLCSQYLALPPRLSQALKEAAARGVDVRILTNSYETGQEVARSLCHYVSLNYYRELLASGVRIYEYHGPVARERFRPYYHAKQFMVDGRWLAVGSFNISIRSSYLESELMVAIHDRALAQQSEQKFLAELKSETREVSPADLALKEQAAGRRMQLARRLEIFY